MSESIAKERVSGITKHWEDLSKSYWKSTEEIMAKKNKHFG